MRNIIRVVIVVMLLVVSNLVQAADFTEQKIGPGPDVKAQKIGNSKNILNQLSPEARDEILEMIYQDYKEQVNAIGFTKDQLDSIVYLTNLNLGTGKTSIVPYTSFRNIISLLASGLDNKVKKVQTWKTVGYSLQFEKDPPYTILFHNEDGTMLLKCIKLGGNTECSQNEKDDIAMSMYYKALVDRSIEFRIQWLLAEARKMGKIK